MYYTMRVKMLQRNQAEMEQRLLIERTKLVSLPYERVHLLTCCIRDIQRSRNDKEDSKFLANVFFVFSFCLNDFQK